MSEDEAMELASKRERTKSKFMHDRSWKAVHDSIKGWHVALVPNFTFDNRESRQS